MFVLLLNGQIINKALSEPDQLKMFMLLPNGTTSTRTRPGRSAGILLQPRVRGAGCVRYAPGWSTATSKPAQSRARRPAAQYTESGLKPCGWRSSLTEIAEPVTRRVCHRKQGTELDFHGAMASSCPAGEARSTAAPAPGRPHRAQPHTP